MSAKKKLQVFISSTYKDLKTERQAAVEAILKAGHIPAGMELFSAGSESQLEIIRRWIDESDVYMLVLGGRYGSVDPKTSLSYTELEYDYAVSQSKPVFAVVINDSALNEKVKVEGKDAMETENPRELKLFREKVLSRISSFFSDPKDIKLAVHETLSDLQNRHQFTGWISGREIPDISPLLEDITRLRIERDDALKQVAEIRLSSENRLPKSTPSRQDEDFKEIITALKDLEITTKVFNKVENEPAISVPILRILDVMRDSLITGVTNRFGASDIHKLLYFNVCPKLEMHDLAAIEKVPGMTWQRYRLTAKGKAFLVFVDKQTPKTPSAPEASNDAPAPSIAANSSARPTSRLSSEKALKTKSVA
ncbi:DUF4062 domain-containing protein [Ottowia thiooxydans]|uniref:DUF4062 domain-containing protein n=1 Tax=Ottowia thiooxydans TaxID=219182 RepID=A0ABV2Q8R6_9BURK